MSLILTLISRNGIVALAIVAFTGWAHLGIQKHDQKVEQRVVAKIEEKVDATATKVRAAQRRVERAQPDAVLERLRERYGQAATADGAEAVRGLAADQRAPGRPAKPANSPRNPPQQ
jgi:hypothetical protein